ncbi:MAG: metallophosphoesterase family protein [Kiritimatiellia bacterium]
MSSPENVPPASSRPLMEEPPSVYMVGTEYLVCALVSRECTMWVECAGKSFCDHSNGILRSARFLHIARIPSDILDKAKSYTIHLRPVIERKPYFSTTEPVQGTTFSFRPVAHKQSLNIINLADAHCLVDAPVKAGSFFGKALDLLILNGDIPNHSNNLEYFRDIYRISGRISNGEVPCVFSRGNHDLRGVFAEQLADYTPTDSGRSYFTFRAGPLWGIVLDTGEDKPDNHPEYGHLNCCECFREEEEAFLDRVIASGEYRSAPLRIVVSHNPFFYRNRPPFDIEQKRFASWCRKLRAINPNLWLSGHLHESFFERPGGPHDTYGAPCPVICSSDVHIPEDGSPARFITGAVTLFADGHSTLQIVDQDGQASPCPCTP